MDDEELLIRADSLLSLIRHREAGDEPLSHQTVRDIDDLLRELRPRTNEIIAARRVAQA